MNDEKQYLKHVYNYQRKPYGSVQQSSPPFPQNFRHYYYQHPPKQSISCSTPRCSESETVINIRHRLPKANNITRRLSVFTKLLVPYYMLTLLVSIIAVILYYVVPFGEMHKMLFSVMVFATIFGAFIGCICVYKWSAITQFKQILFTKNKEWKQSIVSLTRVKRDLKTKVKKMEFSVDTLSVSAADLERTLSQFNELKSELQKLTTKSQQVTDVLDGLLGICEDLTQLLREHAKTELMVAYYDAAVFASRGKNSICLTSNKWKKFRARLDSETRRVFDKGGGFDAIPRDKDDRVDIHDLEKVLSFVIDERGFDDIYSMFS